MKKSRREINVFSVSALDLFASALGAFILMSMIFMVFFTMTSQSASQQENLQPALERCEAQRAQAEGALAECQAQLENSADASALAQCQSDLAAAQAQNADLQAQLEAASSAAGQMEAVNAELESCQRALKKTFVLVVASWKTFYDDVDMHIVDPAGREFYFEKKTYPGSVATFEEDSQYGPSNEVWMHPNAEAGCYRICYKFYEDREDPLRRHEREQPYVRGNITWQEGKIELPVITLKQKDEMQLVADFRVDEEGVVSLDRSRSRNTLGRCRRCR